MASWKKTIATPFRKARTLFNNSPRQQHSPVDGHSHSQQESQRNCIMDLHGEVMACTYEDVRVMWSILDKSKASTTPCNFSS
ncbi:hypothetical protein MLD38_023640 [Melastoma candidum]|uniref:Uncharacterized protein n=1 Tax=Melastoma candidum TaxID=119954 RepID=A0ACB9NQR8_9MYRT|nr:hypothetical protein MLD38_023640 [Melastoma candidum]